MIPVGLLEAGQGAEGAGRGPSRSKATAAGAGDFAGAFAVAMTLPAPAAPLPPPPAASPTRAGASGDRAELGARVASEPRPMPSGDQHGHVRAREAGGPREAREAHGGEHACDGEPVRAAAADDVGTATGKPGAAAPTTTGADTAAEPGTGAASGSASASGSGSGSTSGSGAGSGTGAGAGSASASATASGAGAATAPAFSSAVSAEGESAGGTVGAALASVELASAAGEAAGTPTSAAAALADRAALPADTRSAATSASTSATASEPAVSLDAADLLDSLDPSRQPARVDRARLVVGDDGDRVIVAVALRHGAVEVSIRADDPHLVHQLATGRDELGDALGRHGLSLGDHAADPRGRHARSSDPGSEPGSPTSTPTSGDERTASAASLDPHLRARA